MPSIGPSKNSRRRRKRMQSRQRRNPKPETLVALLSIERARSFGGLPHSRVCRRRSERIKRGAVHQQSPEDVVSTSQVDSLHPLTREPLAFVAEVGDFFA